MKKLIPLLFIAVLLIFFSNNSFSQGNDIETLKRLNRAFLDALVNKDTTELGKVLANDFLLVNPGGLKMNRGNNLANLQSSNQQVVSIGIDSIYVRLLTADVGSVLAWTNNIIIVGGKKTTLKICYQDIYAKRNNEWKAVAAHVTLLGND